MTEQERAKYLEAYYDNEADANKQMSLANAAAAIYMLAIWICYLTDIFKIHSDITRVLINIAFPIGILILLSPLLYAFKFKKELRKPNYKFFVLYSFVFVIAVLNVILPKHSAIAWALCILMTNHYYNPKVGTSVFIAVLIASFGAMFGGMFVGEFDANLLFGNEIMESINTQEIYANGPAGRFEMLNKLYSMGKGFFDLDYNRYLGSVVYYFFPRAIILLLVYFVSRALNKRTYKLLVNEIHVNSEQEKTKTELEVAKEIQLATLPVGFVTSEDIEIQAELKAAKEVGGDFYDYFMLDDDHVAILIGDVSGKGIPAAMFMMKTITCFKNYMSISKTPAEIMKEVNRIIVQGNDSNMFVTCFLAIINTKTGLMKYANAGHNPPIVGQKGKYVYLKCNSGFILGGLPEAFVKDEEITLKYGDTITLYTDGITEAMNPKRELYGEKRLLDLFNKKEYSCLVELHHELKDDVLHFTDGAEQSDDMTYITIKFHGDHYVYAEKLFPGTIETLPMMLDFIKDFGEKLGADSSFINKSMVVADELLSNVVKYGYADYEGDVFIRLLFNEDQKEVIFTIIDTGIPFNPFEVDNKPLEGDVSKMKEGGLGILIVKNLASEYAYDRLFNKNITIIKKKF